MNIRLLTLETEREQVYRLVHDEYLKAGYIDEQSDQRLVHYQGMFDRIPQTDVFIAVDDDGDLVGTNSLTGDSENGIHTLIDFPSQTMRERLTGKSLANSWRLATRSDRRDGAAVVMQLIRATVKRAISRAVETMLFTLHPRHMCRYHIALNMEMIGFAESTLGLHNAPSVLMRAHVKDFPARWLRE